MKSANVTCAGAGGVSHAQGLYCGCECEECPTASCDWMLGCQLMFRILLDTGWESDWQPLGYRNRGYLS